MTDAALVLDASVGVKWFCDEPGSAEARDLLRRHAAGTIRIAVPVLFLYEVLDVARRHFGVTGARSVWESLLADDLAVATPDAEMLTRTIDIAGTLGCTLYDAAAPALAEHLGCTLVSADRRAHGSVAGVMLLG